MKNDSVVSLKNIDTKISTPKFEPEIFDAQIYATLNLDGRILYAFLFLLFLYFLVASRKKSRQNGVPKWCDSLNHVRVCFHMWFWVYHEFITTPNIGDYNLSSTFTGHSA